ncbi:MAG: hypothetical protein ABJF86_17535 [Tateyamaria sp.]|uniref:hypothetical protein n=1 Tax=Tateyamaria sp. TaxID=1929288 RepID=UPI00327355DD
MTIVSIGSKQRDFIAPVSYFPDGEEAIKLPCCQSGFVSQRISKSVAVVRAGGSASHVARLGIVNAIPRAVPKAGAVQ